MAQSKPAIAKEWDYTQHAKYYDYRPNYSPKAIARLCSHVKPGKGGYVVADIGAGTGNLSMLLKDNVGKIIAVEPNDAMREIGIAKTKQFANIVWRVGTGEETGLETGSIDWITFGSSFNTTDRDRTLKESHRVLKKGGYFTCMWNNRDLEEPTQKRIEQIITEVVPEYEHGTRREQQADVIIGSKLFNHLYYLEEPQQVEMPLDRYIEAWKSVKNKYWDLDTEAGRKTFQKILDKMHAEFGKVKALKLTYITKIWTAQREG
ncbi:MAG: methyltransferase domain-containing protein [Candidatus Micrarchaeia archaeon]|jgi:ubiquinone/menaquinone biosynthesis C-methylase UbiE